MSKDTLIQTYACTSGVYTKHILRDGIITIDVVTPYEETLPLLHLHKTKSF